MSDENEKTAAPPLGPRNRAIFIARDIDRPGVSFRAGQVIATTDDVLAAAIGEAGRPATRAEIEIAGLALAFPPEG